MFSPQRSKPLLLGVRINVCADDEPDNIEKWHPRMLGQELLGKGQGDGRHDPADLHDGPEAGFDGCADLVECTGTCNQSHGDKIHAVLDGRDLMIQSAAHFVSWSV